MDAVHRTRPSHGYDRAPQPSRLAWDDHAVQTFPARIAAITPPSIRRSLPVMKLSTAARIGAAVVSASHVYFPGPTIR